MNFTEKSWEIFNRSIEDYHKTNDVNAELHNPYDESELIEHMLYKKNWIDTVQWHLEDIIRDPEINAEEALKIKRWIDKSNQERTDMVEYIDSWFLQKYAGVGISSDAKINTESPAWAIDRFSILALKIYHMKEEASRENASAKHKAQCQNKLNILLEQHKDLSSAIEELLADIASGKKYMKVYKQMKMYNDEDLNPVLYKKK
jgi:hypothetical protein